MATPELGLRERKKLQTRQLIAETARALFTERGFETVTVAEIARTADVSEKTVFNYFPTKEDLVYWRLESFEAELLTTLRERPPGETALAAFGRFVRAPRGMLGDYDPETRERLAALTRMIVASPSLLAREQQIFDGFTSTLAELLAAEVGADEDDVAPRVAANALMGVHRALVDFTRRRIVAGARHPDLAREVRAQADDALALLERGLGDYSARM
jgi:AcrR family transcriptional regulator